MRGKLVILALITCSLYSCIKPPQYPVNPHIQYVSVSSSYVYTGTQDSITVSFTDGYGNISISSTATDTFNNCGLQFGDSEELYSPIHNVFLIDTRSNCITPFASGPVTSSGRYKGISGNIIVVQNINTDKCIEPGPNCPPDTVIYGVVIKDASGNLSNIVLTAPIIINGQQ